MYESFYNLSAEPFQLYPDPRFYFESENHEKAFAYLTYGVNQGEGFVVITGDIGSGKTTLAQKLTTQIDESKYLPASLIGSRVESLDLLQMVGSGFGLDCEGCNKASLLAKLTALMQTKFGEGLKPILLVDEAQNLSTDCLEELRLLTNVHVDYRTALQIIFLAQPQFNKILAHPELRQLRERVAASAEIGALNASDTRGYIEHRLSVAGWKGDPQFSDGVFEKIHDITNGLPRQINKVCSRLLLAGYLDERHDFDEALLEKVITELQNESSLGVDLDDRINGDAHLSASSTSNLAPTLEERVGRLEEDVKEQERLLRQLFDYLLNHLKSSDVKSHEDQ